MPNTHIIIVAAGRGTRFGSALPKQFRLLGDKPVLMHTAIRMGRALPAASITIVLSPDYIDLWQKMCEQHGFVSPTVVAGGDTRWESVRNALLAIAPAADDLVLIHDGVRPVVSKELATAVCAALADADAALPALPVSDSLRQLLDDGSSCAIDRTKVISVQTPQGFRARAITEAYSLPYSPAFTDDASVYEAATGKSPALVPGSPLNIKITHPRDLEIAALLMGER